MHAKSRTFLRAYQRARQRFQKRSVYIKRDLHTCTKETNEHPKRPMYINRAVPSCEQIRESDKWVKRDLYACQKPYKRDTLAREHIRGPRHRPWLAGCRKSQEKYILAKKHVKQSDVCTRSGHALSDTPEARMVDRNTKEIPKETYMGAKKPMRPVPETCKLSSWHIWGPRDRLWQITRPKKTYMRAQNPIKETTFLASISEVRVIDCDQKDTKWDLYVCKET